jgi:hypothetical protein
MDRWGTKTANVDMTDLGVSGERSWCWRQAIIRAAVDASWAFTRNGQGKLDAKSPSTDEGSLASGLDMEDESQSEVASFSSAKACPNAPPPALLCSGCGGGAGGGLCGREHVNGAGLDGESLQPTPQGSNLSTNATNFDRAWIRLSSFTRS